MMKKRTFSLIALAAMLLASTSFVGCSQKDYGADIEGLQKQITDNKTAITALQAALAKGQMITKVEPTATGYKLTMSDNTTLLLTNGTNGTNGKEAVAPKMRVNAAKNWEMSVDGGTTWSEVKDAQGNPIAEAKTFVKDYVKINSEGYVVIGDKTTSFQYDVTIPSVTIMADQLLVLITVPNDNGGFDTAYVPMEGYFDKWSVAEIKPMSGKLTFTVTKTTLTANATINGVNYANGDVVYSSVGVPVVLNPSMIDATQIPFGFVASLANNTPYELPMELVATPGTDGALSTITKASSPTAVWTINLKDAAAYRLKGDATNVALCAQNANNTQTLSDYVFNITEATGSATANLDNVVDTEGYKKKGVVVAPATGIIASTLYTTDPASADKVSVLREDGSIVDGAEGAYEYYTGNYYVELNADALVGIDPEATIEVNLTYDCIGANGTSGTKTLDATFVVNTAVNRSLTIEEPIAATFADLTPTEVKITQADFLTAVFGDNSIAQADFVANGIHFNVDNDAEAKKHGIKVEYFKSNSKVAAPANVAAWDEIRITVAPKAFFAIAPTEYAPKLTFQIDDLTPPTSTQGVNLLFTMAEVAESPVQSVKSIFIDDLYADETTLTLMPTDVSVYSDGETTTPISVEGAVVEFISVDDETGKISATIEADGSVVLTRIGDAPEAPEDVELTIVVLDAWGKEHTFTHVVTLSDENKPAA